MISFEHNPVFFWVQASTFIESKSSDLHGQYILDKDLNEEKRVWKTITLVIWERVSNSRRAHSREWAATVRVHVLVGSEGAESALGKGRCGRQVSTMDELFSRNVTRVGNAQVLSVPIDPSVNAGLEEVTLGPTLLSSTLPPVIKIRGQAMSKVKYG